MISPISKIPISYIRNRMGVDEIRKRILFLDCEFVGGYRELNQKGKWKCSNLLGSICILDYEGEIILNTNVSPTKMIRSYVKWITGFTPYDLKNKILDEVMIEQVRGLVEGRVLVGHDLTGDIAVLKINKESLLGIRDLSTALAVRKCMDDFEGERLKLENVAQQLLGRTCRSKSGHHNVFEDVRAIRDIYRLVEDTWEDTINIINCDLDYPM